MEAGILSELDHAGIVSVFPIRNSGTATTYYARAVEISGAPHFFVMEYLCGGSLDALLQTLGALPPPEAAAIALEIARGLYHIHARGYAHNDLKLENIVFREPVEAGKAYAPVLIDFGVATRLRPPDGVAPYITPPESIRQANMMNAPELGQDIDRRKVDVWGLGVVLYRMLGGRLPFTSRNEKRLTDRILNERPTSLAQLSPVISPELDMLIIDGCLAKDPHNRLSMVELGHQLRAYGDGVVASRDGSTTSGNSFGFWNRRRR